MVVKTSLTANFFHPSLRLKILIAAYGFDYIFLKGWMYSCTNSYKYLIVLACTEIPMCMGLFSVHFIGYIISCISCIHYSFLVIVYFKQNSFSLFSNWISVHQIMDTLLSLFTWFYFGVSLKNNHSHRSRQRGIGSCV